MSNQPRINLNENPIRTQFVPVKVSLADVARRETNPNSTQTSRSGQQPNTQNMTAFANGQRLPNLIATSKNLPNFNAELMNNSLLGSTSNVNRSQDQALIENAKLNEQQNKAIETLERKVGLASAGNLYSTGRFKPRPPVSLVEGLDGPYNSKFGEISYLKSINSPKLQDVDFTQINQVQESTVRTICNGTSQLAALICELYINSGPGINSLGAVLNARNLSLNCSDSRYGCCSNRLTTKLNLEGSNCPPLGSGAGAGVGAFGFCPGTRIQRQNLIGTNCPTGAVPLVGWNQSSSNREKAEAGVGYRDLTLIAGGQSIEG